MINIVDFFPILFRVRILILNLKSISVLLH